MRFSYVVLLLAIAVIYSPGCGSGGGMGTAPAPDHASVSLGPVVNCLRRTVRSGRVTTAPRALDQIARRAQRGAAAVRFEVSPIAPKGTNIATIALERSPAAARLTETHYRAVYNALGGSSNGRLTRVDNAVVAFGARPTAKQHAAIDKCVRPAP